MARATLLQNNFTRGELSPRLYGRLDLDQYNKGAKTLLNFLPLPHGGIVGRPGMKFVAETKNSATASRLRPFTYSTSDAYALEFGNRYIRFYRARGQIVALETDAAITNGTFASNITGWSDKSTGSCSISHDNTNGRLQLNGDGSDVAVAEQEVSIGVDYRDAAHVLKFRVVGASDAGKVKLRIGKTSGATDIVNDVEFLTGYHTYEFDPDGSSSVFIQFRNSENANHDIDDVSLLSDEPVELTTPYLAADVAKFKLAQDANTMWLVHPSYQPMKLTRSGHSSWSLVPYSPTSNPFSAANKYPRAVALFQGRIVFGGSNEDPQKLWFSPVGNLESMATGSGDSDGFTKTISSSGANILWLTGGLDLIAGCTGGEWVVDRPATSPVTGSNFKIARRETSGVSDVAPVEVDNRTLFVERRGDNSNPGRHIRELRFDDTEAEYIAPNLSLLSEHLSEEGITEIAWQAQGWDGEYENVEIPHADRVLWCVRSDGMLLSFTYNPLELVVAWARHETDGEVESVAVIPGEEGDEVWLVVKREIEGSTKRYVEYLDPNVFMDSAISGSEVTATKTWGGLDHLEGEEVTVLADGSPVGTHTVDGGQIELDEEANEVIAGLAFTPTVEVMPLAPPMRDGAPIGAAISVAKVWFRFLNTVGVDVTCSERAAPFENSFRQVSDDVSSPIPPFSGVKGFAAPSSWVDPTVKATQPNPLPICITAFAMEMEANR